LTLLGGTLQAQLSRGKEVEQYLSWEAIEGAWGYELTIRQGDEEIFKTTVNESEISFSLLPGEYEIQIAVLNKFKKTVNTTGWRPLIIKEALQPVIREFSPGEAYLLPGEEITLEAVVFQALDESLFTLVPETGSGSESDLEEEVKLSIIQIDGERVELSFPSDSVEAGEYTLKIKNPSGLEDRNSETVLTLHPSMSPDVRSIDTVELFQYLDYDGVEIKGKNFHPDAEIRIFGQDRVINPYTAEWVNEELIRISFLTKDSPIGEYSLEVTNPSGESDTLKNDIYMAEAPEMVPVRRYPPRNNITFIAAYGPSMPGDSEVEDMDAMPLGFSLKVRHELANARFFSAPGLRPLGIELEIENAHMKQRDTDYVYSHLIMNFKLFYQLQLKKGWSIIPHFGTGTSFLWVNRDSLDGELLQGDIGFNLTLGVSAQKMWNSGFLIEFGIDFMPVYYPSAEFTLTQPWIGGGIRL
ncbi:MAG: hypothetical protein PQJ50_03830, partial [Spirochaetales bacterium]|nr:hypothetical protein [Spirochaetales bacterium]